MGLQAQLNERAFSMLPRVKEAMNGAKYRNAMYQSALSMILDSSKCLDDMDKDELETFQDLVLEYFNEREWIGDHPEQFRFEKGSLYQYDKKSGVYIHCFKQVGFNTKTKAVEEYLRQLKDGE